MPQPPLATDLTTALATLTRLPLPAAWTATPAAARNVWAYPLVGVLVGAVSGGAYAAARFASLPDTLAAVVALAASAWITGALHEDGLADCGDALGGSTRSRRLEILRDSRLGTFGVLTLLLAVLWRWSVLVEIGSTSDVVVALIVAHAVARALIALPLALLSPARSSGQAAGLGVPAPPALLATAAVAAAVLFTSWGVFGLAAGFAAVIAAALATALLGRVFGGYTGDVLGAVEQTSECALLALALLYLL